MADQYDNLKELDDYQLVNDDQDLRGHTLKTHDGRSLGTISRMLVDPDRDHVAALVLEDGRGVPVDSVEIRDGDAYIDPVEESDHFKPATRKRTVARGPIAVRTYQRQS